MQSLTNLIVALNRQFELSVLTSAHDMHDDRPYETIKPDRWNQIMLPNAARPIPVYYSSKSLQKDMIPRLIEEVNAEVLYLNGIYSRSYFLLPVRASQRTNVKVVVCPRGMLQKGALAIKPVKKRVYLTILRFTGLLDKVQWHATNDEEADDIRRQFPKNKGIVIAPNIPKAPYPAPIRISKKVGELKICYLSLITVKKNLLGLLLVLESLINENIFLDIYGPVNDTTYWEDCKTIISKLQGRVSYKGLVPPVDVQQTLSGYHALTLFTRGENFGHVLFEALGVGRPVITSLFTPLRDLEQLRAGFNVDIDNLSDCQRALIKLVNTDQEQFDKSCQAAHLLGKASYDHLQPYEKYKVLFTAGKGNPNDVVSL